MNIKKLFDCERELTSKIVVDQSLAEYKVFARKHLQLHIKLSSLADETGCYKYWLDDELSYDKESVLNKYIIFLRHVLALAIDNNHDDIEEIKVETSDSCLSNQFLNLFIDINDLIMSSSKDHFVTILEDYFTLGISLGFTEDQIKNSFYDSINKKIL